MNRDVVNASASAATLDQTVVLFRDALASLTNKQRAVLIMRYRDAKSFPHIAAELGVSTRAVSRLHFRAYRTLLRTVQERKR